MDNNKNKIDAAIDEVLESKRINQGVQIVKKAVAIVAIISVLYLVIYLLTGFH